MGYRLCPVTRASMSISSPPIHLDLAHSLLIPPSTMIDTDKLNPAYDPHFAQFPSRRSTVFSAKGAVATSQPLGELSDGRWRADM